MIKGILGGKKGAKGAKGGKTADRIRRELAARAKAQSNAQNNAPKNPWQQKNKHGHSGARQRTHTTLHSRDGNKDVFPEEHQEHVRKRSIRDRAERARMESTIHRSENNAIRQTGNKSVDGWGMRGDNNSGVGVFLILILGALAAFFVISNYFPELLDSL